MTYLRLIIFEEWCKCNKRSKYNYFLLEFWRHWRKEQDPEAGIHNTGINTHKQSQNTGASHLYSVTIRSQAIRVQTWTNVKHFYESYKIWRKKGTGHSMRLQCIPWGNITSHFLDVFSWSFLQNLKGILGPGSVPDPYSEYGSRFSIRNSSSRQRLQSVLYVLKLLFLLGAHSTTTVPNKIKLR